MGSNQSIRESGPVFLRKPIPLWVSGGGGGLWVLVESFLKHCRCCVHVLKKRMCFGHYQNIDLINLVTLIIFRLL